jgi:hypothetical protein
MTAHAPEMASEMPFEYAVVRAVPRTDRGEYVNVGVVLYCQAAAFLGCELHVAPERLRALDPDVDVPAVQAALDAIRAVCAGDPVAGPVAAGSLTARFGWLTAPRSTIVQPGNVHAGVTVDPAARLAQLAARLVH